MSPAIKKSVLEGRLTLKGIIQEIAFATSLGAGCCLLCAFAYFAAR